jgi:hypothetical protein
MKKLYILIILFIATFLATQMQAQPGDTVRVLFLGNSFVAANNMPGMFEDLARKAGRNVIVQTHAPGGVYIGDTRPGRLSHAYDPVVHTLIKSRKWDYIVAQDNQGHYSYALGTFPSYAEVYKGHEIIRDTLLKANPCGKLILFSGWCFRNGYPGEFPDGKSMNQRVYENYVHVNKTVRQIVSPISIAWNRAIDSLPAVDLWSPDEAHPSQEGSYVTAATVYATIFRSNPDTVLSDGGVDPAQAALMRRIAFRTVMDSLVPTGLAPHTLSLTASTTQLSAGAGFTKYAWYSAGKLVATTTSATYTPAASGCYQVIGTSGSGCRQRSAVACFTKTVRPAAVGNPERGAASIFPNPGAGNVQIRLASPAQQVGVVVYDLRGSEVYRKSFGCGASFSCGLTELPSGVYLMRIATERGCFTERLVLER